MANKVVSKNKKRNKNLGSNAHIYVNTTANNVIITGTDCSGNVFAWSSAGAKGFKGSRKSTPYAAQVASEDVVKKAMEMGVRAVNVFVGGIGPGRESALMAMQSLGLIVDSITEIGGIAHNGCRPPSRRRT